MASYLCIWGLVVAAAGAAGVRYEIASPLLGIYTVVAGLLLLALGFLLALLRLLWRREFAQSGFALISGGLAVGALAYGGGRALGNPVSDVATDVKAPPGFLGPLYTVKALGPDGQADATFLWPRDFDAAHASEIRRRYPQALPLVVQGAPAAIYPAVAKALRALEDPWKISFEDAAHFHVELERTNPRTRFVDDVVIEVRPIASREGASSVSSTVEIRSRARWAPRGGPLLGDFTTDFGTGYRRILFLKTYLSGATRAAELAEINARKAGAAPARK